MHFINPEEDFDLVIHNVGNSTLDEGVQLSKTLTFYPEELKDNLYNFFTKPFRTEEYFHFTDEEDLENNVVFSAAKSIFEDRAQLLQNSNIIAEQLYRVNGHPKSKGGELFVVYFPHVEFDGEHIKALGIYKLDNKEKFLKAISNENSYDVWTEEGISLSKVDKACLILDIEEEDGYVVASIDKSKGDEFGIWADEFLKIIQRKDEYFDTSNTLSFCKSYVMDKLPEDFEVNRVDQADLLNKSVNFFKENDQFRIDQFADQVLEQEELKQSFEDYRKRFEDVYEVELNDQFDISKNAVKKQARFFKSIIKLDKNFHIYVHGNRQMIEQGVDENGKKYYKLYYNSEN